MATFQHGPQASARDRVIVHDEDARAEISSAGIASTRIHLTLWILFRPSAESPEFLKKTFELKFQGLPSEGDFLCVL
jgi:hypothetical protein